MSPVDATQLALLVGWIALASLVALGLAIFDKRRAKRGRQRIPERTLLAAALVGGSPGLLLGMLLARHKTRKPSFLLGFAAVLAIQAGVVYLLVGR